MNRVRGKSSRLIFLTFLLVFSFTIANVASTSSTVLFVDPPQKLIWWNPPDFTVDINVSDVVDLYGWQANITWDPSVINATSVTEGAFLKGPFLWDTHPYNDDTEPYWEQTKTPTTNLTISPGWNPEGLPPPTLVEAVQEAGDRLYASSSTDGAEVEWGDFGFITGNMSFVASLQVGVQAQTAESNITEQDKIEIKVSNDGGTSWGPAHIVDVFESSILQWVDVTEDFSWTPSMLTDANFKVRMKYKQVGVNATKILVDYLPVKVIDTLVVEDPELAYDKDFDSYASFRYSDTRGNFTVYDFSHDFPSGVTDPSQETSEILRVDFNMKYEAAASTMDDKYKIAYYVGNSGEVVLEDWKSTATPLGNYTWADQTEPNNGVWDWTDIADTRIVVETDKSGGDPNAVFKEYEVWLTVTYLRPTVMYTTQDSEAGWLLININTQGKYPGVDGNGTLATITFDIIYYGETNLTLLDTVLFDSSTPPSPIPHTPEDGYVRITLPGDMTDDSPETPPSEPDGDVDRYDLGVFADYYGTSV